MACSNKFKAQPVPASSRKSHIMNTTRRLLELRGHDNSISLVRNTFMVSMFMILNCDMHACVYMIELYAFVCYCVLLCMGSEYFLYKVTFSLLCSP